MIQIDTEVLKQLAATAKSATNELESASQILNQITSHNDWGCKERHAINDAIQKIRKNMMVLRDSSEGFTSTIVQIAEEFAEVERKIPDMFEGLEGLLAKILTVTNPLILGTPDFSASDAFEDVFDIMEGALDSTGPINITEFSSIAEALATEYTAGGGGFASGGGGNGAFGSK